MMIQERCAQGPESGNARGDEQFYDHDGRIVTYLQIRRRFAKELLMKFGRRYAVCPGGMDPTIRELSILRSTDRYVASLRRTQRRDIQELDVLSKDDPSNTPDSENASVLDPASVQLISA